MCGRGRRDHCACPQQCVPILSWGSRTCTHDARHTCGCGAIPPPPSPIPYCCTPCALHTADLLAQLRPLLPIGWPNRWSVLNKHDPNWWSPPAIRIRLRNMMYEHDTCGRTWGLAHPSPTHCLCTCCAPCICGRSSVLATRIRKCPACTLPQACSWMRQLRLDNDQLHMACKVQSLERW